MSWTKNDRGEGEPQGQAGCLGLLRRLSLTLALAAVCAVFLGRGATLSSVFALKVAPAGRRNNFGSKKPLKFAKLRKFDKIGQVFIINPRKTLKFGSA
jgi:hypothetical protein